MSLSVCILALGIVYSFKFIQKGGVNRNDNAETPKMTLYMKVFRSVNILNSDYAIVVVVVVDSFRGNDEISGFYTGVSTKFILKICCCLNGDHAYAYIVV